GRRRPGARLRAARAGRSRGGARRAADRLQPRWRGHDHHGRPPGSGHALSAFRARPVSPPPRADLTSRHRLSQGGAMNIRRDRSRLGVRVSTSVVVGLLAGALPPSAGATLPARNGKIAFKRYFDASHSPSAILVSDRDDTAGRNTTPP